MSLHDVSKHDDTRLDPKANASDTRAQRDATNTTSIHPVTDATTTKGFLKTGSGQILGNNGSNNVGLFGFDSSGNMVVKVAKTGFDADTASNANLIFNSSQNVFKIIGVVDMTTSVVYATNATPNGNQTAVSTTAHGLGLSPTFIANIKMDSSASAQNGNSSTDNYPNPAQLTGWVGSHLSDYVKATVTVDATNVYLRVMMDTLGFTNGTYTYKATVYLLQETFVA